MYPVPGQNQQVQIMVTWLRAPKGEPHTLCELWVQRHTRRSLARNGQRKLELLETPRSSQWRQRREEEGKGGSREPQALCSLCLCGLVRVCLCGPECSAR